MPRVLIYKVVHFSYIFTFGRSKNKIENIEKFYPLLSKFNDVIFVEWSVQDILKVSLFSTSEVADTCSTSVVTPYLLTVEKFFLEWSTYPDCTDGILHCLPLLFDVGEKLALYVWYVLLITCSFILMKLTCDAILDLFLNLFSLVFF